MTEVHKNSTISYLRKVYRAGRLNAEQIHRLEEIGFDFDGRLTRARERNKPLLDFLVENPHVYTRYELAERFGIDAKKCYEIARRAGIAALIKPVRERIDIASLIADYEAGMSLDELACKYDASYAYVRRITSKCRGNSRAKPISDKEKREIIRLRNNGMTLAAIACSVGRSGFAIGKVLRQNGFETDLRIPKQVIAQAETLIREGDKSYREIAALLGMSPSNVSRVAKSIEAESNYKHNAKKVLCVERGEVFTSAAEAQLHLSAPNSGGVSAACRSGKAYKGYHWKYVVDEDDR